VADDSQGKREPGVRTSVVLPPEVLEKLRQSERGPSVEIRERIARTFAEDALDPFTRELRDALVNIAELVHLDSIGSWHSSPSAHKEFVAAVTQRLAAYTPPPPPIARGPSGEVRVGVSDLFEASAAEADPEMLGKIREQDDRRWHSYPHLEARMQRKSAFRG
jgi:hypothetical protein